MGMRVGGASNAWASQSTSVANWQQNQSNVKNLFSSLKSGDLGSAQKAFASLSSGANSVSPNSPMAQIGKALQSGDLSTAQNLAQAMLDKRASQTASAAPSPASSMGDGANSKVNIFV